jgi:hypothetical protein
MGKLGLLLGIFEVICSAFGPFDLKLFRVPFFFMFLYFFVLTCH